MSLESLKAKAYDLIAQREYLLQQLQEVNMEIAKEANKPKEAPVVETK